MRNATICLLLILCSMAAFGQNQPQWKVVNAVALTNQTAPIAQKTLFTPTAPGLYRLDAYLSATNLPGQQNDPSWSFLLIYVDLMTGQGEGAGMIVQANGVSTSYIGSYVFSIQPGTPVSYLVSASDPPPANSEYSLAFTIEQLER